jgi:hypothetical protein
MAARKKQEDAQPSAAEVQMRESIQRLMEQNAALTAALTQNRPNQAGPAMTGLSQLSVGIRNVSNYVIGLTGSPLPGEGELQLTPRWDASSDPNNIAVISYAWWEKIRRGPIFGKGMIVRDDSVLGDYHIKAPLDRPQDLHVGHALNTIEDPTAFIEESTEAEIRARIMALTSEQTLRRLEAAVDDKIAKSRDELMATEPKYVTNDKQLQREREDRVMMSLPAIYASVDTLVAMRLEQLAPKRDF